MDHGGCQWISSLCGRNRPTGRLLAAGEQRPYLIRFWGITTCLGVYRGSKQSVFGVERNEFYRSQPQRQCRNIRNDKFTINQRPVQYTGCDRRMRTRLDGTTLAASPTGLVPTSIPPRSLGQIRRPNVRDPRVLRSNRTRRYHGWSPPIPNKGLLRAFG